MTQPDTLSQSSKLRVRLDSDTHDQMYTDAHVLIPVLHPKYFATGFWISWCASTFADWEPASVGSAGAIVAICPKATISI